MKVSSRLLLILLCTLTACNGQISTPQAGPSPAADLPATVPDTVDALANDIMVIYQDHKNQYWFGSWTHGLYRYDGQSLVHFTTAHGLSHNRVEEIREDDAGNLYINTSGGVNRFDRIRFSKVPVAMDAAESWRLDPKDLWFKCLDGGGHIYRFDGAYLHRLSLPKTEMGESFIAAHPPTHLDPYAIYSLYKDRMGNIWFGGAVFGLARYDGKSIDWISEEDVTEMHNGPANGVRGIGEDKEGFFWFNAMYRYEVYGTGATQGFTYRRVKSIGSLDGLADGDVKEFMSITRDNEDKLWIATYRDGVWEVDGTKVTRYAVKNGDQEINVFCIYKDNEGTLWLGTNENGAYRFNGTSFEPFKP